MKTEKKCRKSGLESSLNFWGKNCLESIGISLAGAALLFLFFGMGRGIYKAGDGVEILALVPYYIFLAGGFCGLMLVVGYFQLYFPILISMNVTRKKIVGGILLCQIVMLAVLVGISGLIWRLIPGDISSGGLRILPMLIGILLLAAAFCIALGAVIVRWGKIGTVIFAALAALIGAAAGMSVAMLAGSDSDFWMEIVKLSGTAEGGFVRIILAAGILFYAAAAIFSAVITRKVEARL